VLGAEFLALVDGSAAGGDNMKRSITLLAALVVLSVWIAGCNSGPTQEEIKKAFIHQLVQFCAEVDRQLANVKPNVDPGIWADQFALFAKQAGDYQPRPDIDRDKFEIMLTEINNTAGQYRSAQTALTAGDQPTADAALAQADRQFKSANEAAQKYGMPPLETCPQHESGTPAPGTSAAPPTPGTTAAHAAAAWWPRQEMPVAVQQINATELNGRIWVAGGLTSSIEPTASTQVYDPVINSWEQGPPLPEPMHHAMLVTYHDQLAVIGGFRSRGSDMLAVTSPRMFLLDNKTDKWVDGPPLHHPRAAAGAAVVGNEIVVVGGRTGNPQQLVTQTEIYDGTGWHDATDIPMPGDHLAVTADSNYLYAVGGRKFSAGSNTDVVQRYDPKADRWTILRPTPQPVSDAGAAIVDGQLLVAGGEGVTNAFTTVQAYDLTASNATWTTLAALTPGRHGLGVTAIGKTLYAIGGATKAGHTASTNLVAALRFS
jgi:N-acetylneuraminic acid mutarotase